MLAGHGFVRMLGSDGSEWTFTPSLGRIASLGSPREIVQTFTALHGPDAEAEARYVLACLCDQDDPAPLIGWHELAEGGPTLHPGTLPADGLAQWARYLMTHGIAGKARPGSGAGEYRDEFHAAEHISAARVHLGLSAHEAEALSMTELQSLLAEKYPEQKAKEVATTDEYEDGMTKLLALRDRVLGACNG